MPIEVFLHRFDKGHTPTDTEALEQLEDKLRDFLISEGFNDFTIHDSYTGNTTTPHGGEEEEFNDDFHRTGGGGERQ